MPLVFGYVYDGSPIPVDDQFKAIYIRFNSRFKKTHQLVMHAEKMQGQKVPFLNRPYGHTIFVDESSPDDIILAYRQDSIFISLADQKKTGELLRSKLKLRYCTKTPESKKRKLYRKKPVYKKRPPRPTMAICPPGWSIDTTQEEATYFIPHHTVRIFGDMLRKIFDLCSNSYQFKNYIRYRNITRLITASRMGWPAFSDNSDGEFGDTSPMPLVFLGGAYDVERYRILRFVYHNPGIAYHLSILNAYDKIHRRKTANLLVNSWQRRMIQREWVNDALRYRISPYGHVWLRSVHADQRKLCGPLPIPGAVAPYPNQEPWTPIPLQCPPQSPSSVPAGAHPPDAPQSPDTRNSSPDTPVSHRQSKIPKPPDLYTPSGQRVRPYKTVLEF